MGRFKAKFYIVLSLLGMLSLSYSVKATHIAGGEITWRCVGTNTYLIQLVVYRGCGSTSMGSNSFALLCVPNGSLINYVPITWPSPVDITPICSSGCTRCQSSSCSFPAGVQKFVVNSIVSFNTSCCNIGISWSESSRIDIYGIMGQNFYIEAEMNICQTPADNSPQFSTDPFVILCQNQNFEWNFGVTDPDTNSLGKPLDSLVYEMTPALVGYGQSIIYGAGLTYAAPIHYYGTNPNAPFPMGFHLDPITGNIQFRPTKSEVAVFAIKVKEYRAGVLIGEVVRDCIVNIIVCGSNRIPTITTPGNQDYKEVCAGDTVKFDFTASDQDSSDTVVFIPDNQFDKGSWTIDTNHLIPPTATFTWVTTAQDFRPEPYKIICTVSDNVCPLPGTIRKTFRIFVKRNIAVTDTITNLGCGNFKLSAYPLIGSGINYQWKGNNFNSTLQNFYLKLNKPGIYPVTLKITANNACSVPYYYDTIRNDSMFYSEKMPDTAVCYGEKITLSASHQFGEKPYRYSWSTSSTDTLQFNTVTVIKDSVITCKISDAKNCQANTSIKLSVKQLPNAEAGKDVTICYGDSARLVASGGVKYVWNTGISAMDIAVSPKTDQYYTVTATDSVNCSASDSVLVKINPLPIVDAGQDDTLCISDKFHKLTGSPSSASAYWIGPALKADTFDLTSPIITDESISTFYYHYSDSNNCTNTDSVTMTVYANPEAFGGDYSIECINSNPVRLLSSHPNGIWHGNYIIGKYFYPALAGSGTHQLVYEAFNHVCNDFDTTFITVRKLPDTSLSYGNKQLNAVTGFKNYDWYRNDSLINSTDTSILSVTTGGYYYVVVTDTFGCTDTSSSHYIDITGLSEMLSKNQLTIYPNPANDVIMIQFSQPVNANWKYIIRSVDGKEMLSGNISGSKLLTQTININSLQKGIYFIEILTDNQITNFRFVKN